MSTQPSPATPSSMTDKEAIQFLEAVNQRRNVCQQKLAENLASLRATEQQLASDQALAREHYGTDDPQSLRNKILEIRKENETGLAEYEKGILAIEKLLSEVESGMSPS